MGLVRKDESKDIIHGDILFLDTEKGEVKVGQNCILRLSKYGKNLNKGDCITMRIELEKRHVKWRLNGVDCCGIYWKSLKSEIKEFVPFVELKEPGMKFKWEQREEQIFVE